MKQVKQLSKYLVPLTDNDINFLLHEIERSSVKDVVNYCLKRIDCTRVINGMRMMQTIGAPYRYELSYLNYLLDNHLLQDEKEIILAEIFHIHENNLKYEEEHPPVIYDTKKKGKPKVTKEKVVKEKVPKISRAELKMATRMATLKFNLKKI